MSLKIEYNSDINEIETILGKKQKAISYTGTPPSQYDFYDFIDKETLSKVLDFEKNNPEKIKLWQKEDKESYEDYYKLRRFLNRNPRGHKSSDSQSESTSYDILNRCKLLFPTNKFVISVSQWYEKTHRITEKQLDVLVSILNSYVEHVSQSIIMQLPDPSIENDSITVRFMRSGNKEREYYFEKEDKVFFYVEILGLSGIKEFIKFPKVSNQTEATKILQIPKTLYMSIDKELSIRGLTITKLPGKIATITSEYDTTDMYNKKIKYIKYNVVFRDDLINVNW